MKTKILPAFIVLFFAASTANAQITEGKYLLGGSFGLTSATNQNSNSVSANLQFGKVIKENTVVGIIASIAVSNNKQSGQSTRVDQYSAGVFYRKYKPLNNNFFLFGEIDASYQASNTNYYYFTNVNQTLITKNHGGYISFTPGVAYSVTKHLQMELTMQNLASLYYTHIKTIDSSLPPNVAPQKASNISANVNLNSSLLNSFGLGFKLLLGK